MTDGIIFKDIFDRADGVVTAPWTNSGSWTIVSGELKSVTGHAHVLNMDVGTDNYDISLRLRYLGTGLQHGYIITNYVDALNFVYLAYEPGTDNTTSGVKLSKFIAGVKTNISYTAIAAPRYDNSVIRLTVNSGVYSAYLNGVLFYTGTPTGIPTDQATSTKVGIGASNTSVYYTEYIVRQYGTSDLAGYCTLNELKASDLLGISDGTS